MCHRAMRAYAGVMGERWWLFPLLVRPITVALAMPVSSMGVPGASVQETTIRRLRVKIVEENEGLLPQMSQRNITDSFPI